MNKLISFIIPSYNEEKNISLLYKSIMSIIRKNNYNYEIIFIDDGSMDNTFNELLNLNKNDKNICIIKFKRNFGQTAAWNAGFRTAKGDLIITMDADLQNDPSDIPRLIEKLNQGYDVVSGWRFTRQDSLVKKLFSRIANIIRKLITNEKIHDAGCALKIYRKECLKDLYLYGEMHRYITTILSLKGYKVGEVKVNHSTRKFGKTKYNAKRLLKGLLDLLFIKFWNDFSARPLHFFGMLSFIQFILAFLILVEQIIKAIFVIGKLDIGPLLLFSGILMISGLLTFSIGFLAEIMIRTYYKDKESYVIERII